MVITADDQTALLNASLIISVVDTDECRELAAALDTAARTGNERALQYVISNAPDVCRRLLLEASVDAWIPDGWSGSLGEMDAASALASGRERQAQALQEVIAILQHEPVPVGS